VGDGVGALERGDDAFDAGELLNAARASLSVA
jgi:hypothetical protein